MVELVLRFARGDLDALHGRFVHAARDDLDALLAQAAAIAGGRRPRPAAAAVRPRRPARLTAASPRRH